MQRRWFRVLALTIAGSSLAAAPASALTVEAYVAQVLARSPEAALLEVDVVLAQAEAEAAGLWPNPSLAWSREVLPDGAEQDIVTLSVPLALSGRLGLLSDAAETEAQAAIARQRHEKNLLAARAAMTFYRAVAAERSVLVLEASHRRLEELAQAMLVRERAGEASGYDRLRLELERSRLESELAAARTARDEAHARARGLLGPEAPTELVLEGEIAPASGRVPAVDAGERGDVAALEQEAAAARLRMQAARRRWIPELELTGGGKEERLERHATRGYVAGAALLLPLFDRGQGERAIADAEAQRRAAAHARAAYEAQVELGLAQTRFVLANERLDKHHATILSRAIELERIARMAYGAGSADLLLLVDAETSVRRAESERIELELLARDALLTLIVLSGAGPIAEDVAKRSANTPEGPAR